MVVEKIHLYIAIFAGAVMTTVNIFLKASLLEACTRLIVTLVVFYVAGAFAERYIRKKIFNKPGNQEEEKPADEEDGEPNLSDDAEPNLTDDGFIQPEDEQV